MEMELIEEWNEDSAYTFCKDKSLEEVNKLINDYGCDEDVIIHYLEEKYPSERYFVLVDYIDDRNMGYFWIRIWAKDIKYEEAFDFLMEYWDSLPEDQKWLIDKKLKELGV